ncbi:MAG: pyridoxine 5'-phosphate synthase [Nitrospirae bacterium]|nr:MAG: pyridoxine 5'-phosphate synthase [Nitrospirota bacterium]
MARLGVNIDHIATVRQARGGKEPDPVAAAPLVEMAGADGLVVHLREDRRHIQDRDLTLLREIVHTKLNLEMAATVEVKPHLVTLVPERREELTTEGGLDVDSQRQRLKDVTLLLHQSGIAVSLFIDPVLGQIKAARRVEADCIELHTGRYANALGLKEQDIEFEALAQAARAAYKLELAVSGGHGLTYHNVRRLRGISEIVEYNIGHSIIARAIFIGLERAVREMKELLR